MSLFYKTKKDLTEIIIPYLKEGLKSNEYCIWVISDMFSIHEAEGTIREVMPDFDHYLKHIQIIPYNEWYFENRFFNAEKVLNSCENIYNQALSQGFDGIRITEDTNWLKKNQWADFIDFEKQVNSIIGEYNIIALCAYSLNNSDVNNILDVSDNHKLTVIKNNGDLKLMEESEEHKRLSNELLKSEERVQLERKSSEELINIIFNSLPISIYLVKNSKFEFVNPVFSKETGYSLDELLGRNCLSIVCSEDRDKVRKSAISLLKGGPYVPYEYRFINKNGELRWRVETVVSIKNRDESLVLGNSMDITETKQMEEQLKYLSLHDLLTGLYNRLYFEEEMRRLEKGRHSSIGIILCDIDGLKLVNDTFGHSVGDKFLIAATSAIKSVFRSSDMIARIGGDEFAVLLPDCDNDTVKNSCRRIKENVAIYNNTHKELPLSVSMGFAVKNNDSVSLNEIFKEADNNMYREKLTRSHSYRNAIVQTLMKTLAARDVVTEEHAERLYGIMKDLALAVGVPEHKLSDLQLLARFHDIGKVGVADRILLKPGPLSSEEIIEMQRHSEIGHSIAQSLPELVTIADWILKHHEWWNGNGYPLGLKREDIPIECRILAIADAYDAMINDRPYRKAVSERQALLELKRNAGVQFDPYIVDKFINQVNL